ncbi:hypothetical protein PENTCL1PPCAC_24295, partial [Pristionchus entomophagus]
ENSSKVVLTFSIEKNKGVFPWKIEFTAIRHGRILDAGKFGQVYDGTLFDREIVALKTINMTKLEDFMKEAEIARECYHPNVLQTIGICISLKCIITEFMKNGSLKSYIRSNFLSAEDRISVAQKIASGMSYLVSRDIVHRDLAARNVLVGETIDTIKIADFGLSRSLAISPYYTTHKDCFPKAHTAPEAFVLEGALWEVGKVTRASDVWSYGVVLWELYSNGE